MSAHRQICWHAWNYVLGRCIYPSCCPPACSLSVSPFGPRPFFKLVTSNFEDPTNDESYTPICCPDFSKSKTTLSAVVMFISLVYHCDDLVLQTKQALAQEISRSEVTIIISSECTTCHVPFDTRSSGWNPCTKWAKYTENCLIVC